MPRTSMWHDTKGFGTRHLRWGSGTPHQVAYQDGLHPDKPPPQASEPNLLASGALILPALNISARLLTTRVSAEHDKAFRLTRTAHAATAERSSGGWPMRAAYPLLVVLLF